MTQQVEVRLTDGTREVFEAGGWDDTAGTTGGGLDVFAEGGEEVIASFAPGQWSFVSKVVDSSLTVGELRLNIGALCDRAREEQADDSGRSDAHCMVSVADLTGAVESDGSPRRAEQGRR